MIDAPDAYEFTSHRADDRERALDMTRRTIEIAAEFRARYVVLHMGSVPMSSRRWTRPLTAMVREGDGESPRFARKRIAFIKKREKVAPLYYRRAIEALESLVDAARDAGVVLAVESRSRYEDVPTEREMLRLQDHFGDCDAVAYWHDFGHVQLKHNLGLLDHGEWLDRIRPHLLGGHVHDVQWPARDHRVPFTGELDYADLLGRFPPECPLVWELSPSRKTPDIRDALAVWRHQFPDRT